LLDWDLAGRLVQIGGQENPQQSVGGQVARLGRLHAEASPLVALAFVEAGQQRAVRQGWRCPPNLAFAGREDRDGWPIVYLLRV
jgi:hypothetical protein